ncbi:MAG: protein O-mannosyl-transferase [Blastocatellia bacterium]
MTARKSRKSRTPSAGSSQKKPATLAAFDWKWQAGVLAIALLLTVIAYSNALHGKFVYDDTVQIADNPYIQQGQHFWKAMTSDVWAFKGNPGEAKSNYWRPAFVGWLILNYKLFGADTTGWHVFNILAHLLVTLLGYRLLLGLGLRPVVCAIVTWMFAAHPIHVQSVTWISGVPDLLVSGFLFGSFLCYLALRKRPLWFYWAGAILLYFAALFSKEVAVTFPAIIFFSELILNQSASPKVALKPAFYRSLPFLAAAAIFLLLHYQVLHGFQIAVPTGPSFSEMLLSIPSVLLFYIRQTLFPFTLSPFHGLRPVTFDHLGLANFVLPLVVLTALGYLLYKLARRRTAVQLGLIWFLLPLAPALNTRIFLAEMLVQDRYLYLPLFGALIIIGTGLVTLAERFLPVRAQAYQPAAAVAGLLISIGFAVLARVYNPVWNDDLTLFEYGVKVDPSSSFAYSQLANQYQRAGRLPEAKQALVRALEIKPDLTNGHILLGIIANREQRYDDAIAALKPVLAVYPDYDVALDQLGLAYQQQGKLDEAIALFDQGRQRMVYKREAYTINIAVLETLAGRKSEALAELESLIPQLETATSPDILKAWWYLGELYRVQGSADNARSAYTRYLKATEDNSDPQVKRLRDLATQSQQQLKK